MSNVILMYIYFIAIQPPPLGLRVVVTDVQEAPQYMIDAGEEVGLATVYRVLTQFEQAGICIRHNFEEGHAVYELTPSDHHDHMVCLDTGDVIEFTDDVIEERQKILATEHGYEIIDHSMVLYVKPVKK